MCGSLSQSVSVKGFRQSWREEPGYLVDLLQETTRDYTRRRVHDEGVTRERLPDSKGVPSRDEREEPTVDAP